jgi:hypothetical protein
MKAGAAMAAAALWGALAAVAVGAPPAQSEERTFALEVGAAAPAEPRILAAQRGDTVVIAVTSEIAAEIHLHGYNLEARFAAGGAATWRFAARATGRYPINLHRPGDSGHRHAPPIAYLEVRPR